ncbi:MAG: methyltransferase domain-containing protein [Thaumarchaeota archaeon]|nr:methyltransferase domain-containing protein [Nitrososphaerota archaeon]
MESLERIVPIYEKGSRRIALFSDKEMREQVVKFAVRGGSSILDLGSGPGTMAAIVSAAGGRPVLLDVSRTMLHSAPPFDKVQSTFESLPFRDGVFDGVVAGFSLRDARDLQATLQQICRVIVRGGRFGFCDLGKPTSAVRSLIMAVYLRAAVPLIGLLTGGRSGLGFASLYQTYLLTLDNRTMVQLLGSYFPDVAIKATQLGAAIVVTCRVKGEG